jgi:hypothetical protein
LLTAQAAVYKKPDTAVRRHVPFFILNLDVRCS